MIDPPRPPDDEPDPMRKAPLLPRLAVPELNISIPLTPAEPAFAVRTLNVPLLELEPRPLARVIAPPVSTLLSPAVAIKSPPDPLDPLPTVKNIEPPLPPEDDPDPMYKAPLFPRLAAPELKTSTPLTPLVPAFDVRIRNSPLLVEDPDPLTNVRTPPV